MIRLLNIQGGTISIITDIFEGKLYFSDKYDLELLHEELGKYLNTTLLPYTDIGAICFEYRDPITFKISRYFFRTKCGKLLLSKDISHYSDYRQIMENKEYYNFSIKFYPEEEYLKILKEGKNDNIYTNHDNTVYYNNISDLYPKIDELINSYIINGYKNYSIFVYKRSDVSDNFEIIEIKSKISAYIKFCLCDKRYNLIPTKDQEPNKLVKRYVRLLYDDSDFISHSYLKEYRDSITVSKVFDFVDKTDDQVLDVIDDYLFDGKRSVRRNERYRFEEW